MIAIGLYNRTHSCPWESLLAAGAEECEKADNEEVIDCEGYFINDLIRGKHVCMNRNENERMIISKNQIYFI